MDSDRKSTVSSFYHGRRPSNDALNGDFPRMSSSGQRQNRDDVSSFYNPERNSFDRLNDNRPIMSAGYNKNSFFNSGREEPLKGGKDEEEEAWMCTPISTTLVLDIAPLSLLRVTPATLGKNHRRS